MRYLEKHKIERAAEPILSLISVSAEHTHIVQLDFEVAWVVARDARASRAYSFTARPV
ncbi:MAG: hypothetical protein NVS3B20_25780 [Polyangiales bacterium]